jgi:hypothetical protein
MHIIILGNGFYFTGKVGELRLVLAKLAGSRLKLTSFLRQNQQ